MSVQDIKTRGYTQNKRLNISICFKTFCNSQIVVDWFRFRASKTDWQSLIFDVYDLNFIVYGYLKSKRMELDRWKGEEDVFFSMSFVFRFFGKILEKGSENCRMLELNVQSETL